MRKLSIRYIYIYNLKCRTKTFKFVQPQQFYRLLGQVVLWLICQLNLLAKLIVSQTYCSILWSIPVLDDVRYDQNFCDQV